MNAPTPKKGDVGEGNYLANELAALTKAAEQKRAMRDRDWKEGRAVKSKMLGSQKNGDIADPAGEI